MPDTGGANIPALNDLLSSWGVALGDRIWEGDFTLGGHSMYYASGTSLIKFPADGTRVFRSLKDQGIDNSLFKKKKFVFTFFFIRKRGAGR